MNKKLALVLVIDGLGVGELPDVKISRKQDCGTFTLKHVLDHGNFRLLKNFIACGLGNINSESGLPKADSPLMSYGKNNLAHYGADTFWGHQEIVGTKPKKPQNQHVIEVSEDIVKALKLKGYKIDFWNNNKAIIIVNEKVVIGDNLEADPGLVISVTGPLDYMPFEQILEIGKIVRSIVKTSRVNVHGGKFVDLKGLLIGVEEKLDENGKKFIGHNVPKTGIYPSPHFRQIQLGYGAEPKNQVTTTLTKNGYKVTLIGKAGDVITCNKAKYLPFVQTDGILKLIVEELKNRESNLILANVQESDLSGHAQKPDQYFKVLETIDKTLPVILNTLQEGDLFIITGDHGNDPIFHGHHSREYTPLLVYLKNKNYKAVNLGIRETLSDIGATLADYFSVTSPENGTSFLGKITLE